MKFHFVHFRELGDKSLPLRYSSEAGESPSVLEQGPSCAQKGVPNEPLCKHTLKTEVSTTSCSKLEEGIDLLLLPAHAGRTGADENVGVCKHKSCADEDDEGDDVENAESNAGLEWFM